MTTPRMRISEELGDAAVTMYERTVVHLATTLAAVPKKNFAPHCDCKANNIRSGVVLKDMKHREDEDHAWEMLPTELNQKGHCMFCNYVPFYKEIA